MAWKKPVSAALLVIGVFALTFAALAVPRIARAECNGGDTFADSAARARGAIVGVVRKVDQDTNAFYFVSEVTVQRAIRVSVGPVWHGAAYPNICAGDSPEVGDRVVVLLGVRIDGVEPQDLAYTIGVTVTPAQVARLADGLPDTAASPVASGGGHEREMAATGLLGGLFVLSAVLLVRLVPRRRAR